MAINVTDIYNRHRADHDLKKQDVSDPAEPRGQCPPDAYR